MIPFIEQAGLYALYHQNPVTRYIHITGITLLLLSLMIILGFVHVLIPGVFEITFAEIAAVALLIYYFRLNWRIALVLTPIFIVLLWVASLFSYSAPSKFSIWSFVIIFIVACILQFIGYLIEGKRPSLSDLFRLELIAPMALIAEIFFIAGKMQTLNESIHGRIIASEPVEDRSSTF